MAILAVWLICGIAAACVASSKRRSGLGWFALGLLFGPFAFLTVGFMAPKEIKDGPADPPGPIKNILRITVKWFLIIVSIVLSLWFLANFVMFFVLKYMR
jgi:hypothetical protein